MNFTGFVSAGLQLGLQSVVIKPERKIFNIRSVEGKVTTIHQDIVAQATIEEHHHDQMEITDHPVEQGASIVDHAFKRPAELTLKLGWSDSPSKDSGLLGGASLSGAVAAASPAASQVLNVVNMVQAGVQTLSKTNDSSQLRLIYEKLLELQSSRALFSIKTGKRDYKNMLCMTLSTETDFKSAHSLPITMVCKEIILVNTKTVTIGANARRPEANAAPLDNGVQQPKANPVISSLSQLKLLKNMPRTTQ